MIHFSFPTEHVFLVGSYSRCLLIHFVYFYTVDSRKIESLIDYFFRKNKIQEGQFSTWSPQYFSLFPSSDSALAETGSPMCSRRAILEEIRVSRGSEERQVQLS